MYLQLIIAFFVATLLSIHGVPVKSVSVYDAIKLSADDPSLKCPYVRSTKLIEPEPDFLTQCSSFKVAQTLTKVTEYNVNEALCLLYYNYFERLCYLFNTATEDSVKGLLSNKIIDGIPKTYQNSRDQVCETMITNRYFVDTSKPGVEVVQKLFEEGTCPRLCTDFYKNVRPICSLSAFMINITNSFNQTQKLVLPDVKAEKGPNKPHLTEGEHNADTSKSTGVQAETTAEKQALAGALAIEQVAKEPPAVGNEDSTFASQSFVAPEMPLVNLALEKLTPSQMAQLPNSFEHRWQFSDHVLSHSPGRLVELGNKKQIDQSKSPAQQISTSPNGVLVNSGQSNNEQVPSSTTLATLNFKPPKDSNVNVPRPLDNKSTGNDAVHDNQNADLENTGQFDKPEVVQPDLVAKKPDDVVVKSSDDAKNGNEGNTQQVSPPLVDEQKEMKEQDMVGEVGGGKLSTKNDVDIKPETDVKLDGDPRQDVQDQNMLPDEDDDVDLGPADMGNDREDYNEVAPKSSEVKSALPEKSKPLETIEGVPSFAANFQNQSIDDSDSYFFSYFMMVCIMFICGYVAYHNKQKILALVVEGRRGRRPSRTRRPNSANYRKLDSNLEEAVTSSCNKNATQVIY